MMLFCRNFFVSKLILLKSHPYCFYSLPEIETINSIQFSFIFRHTYTLAMHNTEVQSKILDSKKK